MTANSYLLFYNKSSNQSYKICTRLVALIVLETLQVFHFRMLGGCVNFRYISTMPFNETLADERLRTASRDFNILL